jgi:hypothetical protein
MDIDRLRRELGRVRRPHQATITPAPGVPPVEVSVGDMVEIVYEGEVRRVRVEGVMPWGIRYWDLEKEGMRAFRFEKIGRQKPDEMDTAAS